MIFEVCSLQIVFNSFVHRASMWCAHSLEQLKRALWFTVTVIGGLLMSRLFWVKRMSYFPLGFEPSFLHSKCKWFFFPVFSFACISFIHTPGHIVQNLKKFRRHNISTWVFSFLYDFCRQLYASCHVDVYHTMTNILY